jgi:hypothetical protein
MRAGGQCTSRALGVSTWTDDDAARLIDVDSGRKQAGDGSFWRELSDLRSMVGDELGAETEYHPEGYALLIGVTPPDDAGLAPQVLPWPLETPLAETGVPIGDADMPRCGTIEGEDAATLEAALAGANPADAMDRRWCRSGRCGIDRGAAAAARRRPLQGAVRRRGVTRVSAGGR